MIAKYRFNFVNVCICGAFIFLGLLGPGIAPQNPYALESLRLEDAMLPPGAHSKTTSMIFILGSDAQGRDILSALFYGLQTSLMIGFLGAGLALVVGVTLGLWAGWRRGFIDMLIMRIVDIQLAFPSMLIALFLMAVWGRGLSKIVLAVAIAHWVIFARTVRAVALVEREKDYIAAGKALGASSIRIMFRHLLPNLMSSILVILAIELASVIMLEATLSFLGLGAPVTRPSLGLLVKFGYDEVFSGAWWIWLFPGVTLALVVYAFNRFADELRER